MMVIPYQVTENEYTLYVILGTDNVDRIEEYDPAVVRIQDLPLKWLALRLIEIVISTATEAEFEQMMVLAYAGKQREALGLVTRGFRWRPDRGDHHGPPLNVTPGQKGTKQ